MRRVTAWSLFAVAFAAGVARAEEDPVVPAGGLRSRPTVAPLNCPPCAPIYPPGTLPGTPGSPGSPGTPNPMPGMPPDPNAQPNPLDARLNNPFAQPTEAGGQAARSFNENFDGDFGGVFYTRRIATGFTTVPQVVGFAPRVVGTTQQVSVDAQGNRVVTNVPVVVNDPIIVQRQVAVQQALRLSLAGRYNGVQIVDNDNPRPTDRVYFGYNAYQNLGGSLNPGVGGSDVQRQTGGFEKTFLDGDASFGMRLPFVQQYGPVGLGSQVVGDLSLLFKYAFYNNHQTGDVVSAGFVLTTPTGGGSAVLVDGSTAPHSWLFQPWGGFVKTFDRLYVQGISNLIVPSDGRDPTLWGNSLGVGYWLYRNPNDKFLTGIIPVAEFHVRTPLNDRNPAGLVYLQDQVNMTAGVHFRFTRATVSGAVNVPLVGPRPWNVEAMGYVNYNF